MTTWQRGFQIPASPIAEGIFAFHDDLRIFLTGILCFVRYILAVCLNRFVRVSADATSARLVHASTIEIVWTIIPALILIVIAIPSFSLLYSVDEIIEPSFTVKVVGHQWYWSYEFLDPEVVATLYNDSLSTSGLTLEVEGSGSFDSYRLSDDELLAGEGLTANRLLTVDNHLFLPTERHVHARVTSADVIHSWAIPAFGVKLDACPGRLNQTSLFIKREGTYYGQCSEICGVNHGFRPIGIVSLDILPGVKAGSYIDFEPVLAFLETSVNGLFFFKLMYSKINDETKAEILQKLRDQPIDLYIRTATFDDPWIIAGRFDSAALRRRKRVGNEKAYDFVQDLKTFANKFVEIAPELPVTGFADEFANRFVLKVDAAKTNDKIEFAHEFTFHEIHQFAINVVIDEEFVRNYKSKHDAWVRAEEYKQFLEEHAAKISEKSREVNQLNQSFQPPKGSKIELTDAIHLLLTSLASRNLFEWIVFTGAVWTFYNAFQSRKSPSDTPNVSVDSKKSDEASSATSDSAAASSTDTPTDSGGGDLFLSSFSLFNYTDSGYSCIN